MVIFKVKIIVKLIMDVMLEFSLREVKGIVFIYYFFVFFMFYLFFFLGKLNIVIIFNIWYLFVFVVLCEGCKMINGVGFNSYFNECDLFVYCYFGELGLWVIIRKCLFG